MFSAGVRMLIIALVLAWSIPFSIAAEGQLFYTHSHSIGGEIHHHHFSPQPADLHTPIQMGVSFVRDIASLGTLYHFVVPPAPSFSLEHPPR